MSSSLPLPSYADLLNVLDSTDASFMPSQVQGYICGVICATNGKADTSWQEKFLDKKSPTSSKQVLQQLFETSLELIADFSFDFGLILPEDKLDINLRTEALGTWCQGFLMALEQYNIPIQHRTPSDLTDTINDLLEISQVGFGDLETNEEDETAYFELVEYVRLAVLMIFHEINNPDTLPSAEETSFH